MGKASRDKGARWEREAAKRFFRVYSDARRGGSQSRSGRDNSDVEGTPWWIECKVGAQVSPLAALRQAEDATDGRVPFAVCKQNSKESGGRPDEFVVIRLVDFIDILQRLELCKIDEPFSD